MNRRPVLPLLLLTLSFIGAAHAEDYGRFLGKVVAEWLSNGRDMKLVQPFAYVDPTGTTWDAPAGSVVDGASIPKFAWSIIGGPFEGKYRDASVIHDVACEQKRRSWQDAHRAFYTGMLADGVNETKAKVMYGAVYHFGPRWPAPAYVMANVPIAEIKNASNKLLSLKVKGDKATIFIEKVQQETFSEFVGPGTQKANVSIALSPEQDALTQKDFEELKKEIESKNLSLKAIEDYSPQHPTDN